MTVLALAAVLAVQAAQNPSPSSIEGLWKSPGGNSIIAVAPCGNSMCGTVAWASERAKKDSAKTTSQLVGTQILTNLQQDSKGRWVGKIFIPDRNMHATAKIQLANPGQLRVSGCLAGKSLCRAALWTRTAEPFPASN